MLIFILFHVCLSNSQPCTFAGIPALFLWESLLYHHSIAGVSAIYALSLAGVPAIFSFSLAGVPASYSFFQLQESSPHLFFKCGSPRPYSFFSIAGVPATSLFHMRESPPWGCSHLNFHQNLISKYKREQLNFHLIIILSFHNT